MSFYDSKKIVSRDRNMLVLVIVWFGKECFSFFFNTTTFRFTASAETLVVSVNKIKNSSHDRANRKFLIYQEKFLEFLNLKNSEKQNDAVALFLKNFKTCTLPEMIVWFSSNVLTHEKFFCSYECR